MNTFKRMLLQFVVTVVGFLPAIFFFAVKAFLDPTGFWQNFAIYGVGLWFLGTLQIILLTMFIALSLVIWAKKENKDN